MISMATQRINRKKYLKIFSSKTTDQIHMKLYVQHLGDIGNKWYITEFIIIFVAMETKGKKLKILWNLLLLNYWPVSCETLLAASVWYGKQTLQIFILFYHYYGCHGNQKKKDKNKCLKIFFSNSYKTLSEP